MLSAHTLARQSGDRKRKHDGGENNDRERKGGSTAADVEDKSKAGREGGRAGDVEDKREAGKSSGGLLEVLLCLETPRSRRRCHHRCDRQ